MKNSSQMRIFGLFSAFALMWWFLPKIAFATVTDYDSSPYITKQTVQLGTDVRTGSFTYSYPFTLPAGRNGLQPSLQLNYNSQDTDSASEVGYGWSLSIPFIERSAKYGVDDLYDTNVFSASSSGELVNISLSDASHGTYGAKIDGGSFLTYLYNADESWTVTDKSGVIYTYGASTDDRLDDPFNATHVSRWMLSSVEDLSGNIVTYSYSKGGNQIYPENINYTGNGSSLGIFDVDFTLEARNDDAISFADGFSVQTSSRISEVSVKVNGSEVRHYQLTYAVADNGIRSLLSGIVESATTEDGSSTLSKPATTFEYTSSPSSWTEDTSFATMPVTIAGTGSGSLGVYIFDANADGLPDIIKAQYGTTGTVYINDGNNGWVLDSSYVVPVEFSGPVGQDMGVRVFDLNGDGFLDLASSRTTDAASAWRVYMNNTDGTGWTENASIVIPVAFSGSGGDDYGTRIFDADGDGLSDIIRYRVADVGVVYINNGDGTGWTQDVDYIVPVGFSVSSGSSNGVLIFDVNGDGLNDLVHSSSSSSEVYINNGNGTGWTQDLNYTVPVAFIGPVRQDMGVRSMDVNGDGLTDLVYSRYITSGSGGQDYAVYLNDGDGTGWTQDASISVPMWFTTSGHDDGVRGNDVNGDGLDDIIYSKQLSSTVSDNQLWLADGEKADLLSNITDSRGAQTSVAYASYVEKDGEAFFPIEVVDEVTNNDGLGNVSITQHDYAAPDYYYSDEYDRKFAGFHEATTIDSVGNITKQYFHQGNDADVATLENSDEYALINKMYLQELYDPSGSLVSSESTRWTSDSLATNRWFTHQASVSKSYVSDSPTETITTTWTYDSTTGELTSQSELGLAEEAGDGTITDVGDDSRTTNYTYAVDPYGVILDLPASITVLDSAGIRVSEVRYYYDDLAYGAVEIGNKTQQQQWISGSTYADTFYAYNGFGNVLNITDSNGSITDYIYDLYDLHPEMITNDLGQATTYDYDLSSSKPTITTTSNGVISEIEYDAFDRPVIEYRSSESDAATLNTTQTWSYDDLSSPRSNTHRVYLSPTVFQESITYFDGFDRTIETKTLDDNGIGYNETEITYDQLGRVAENTLPEASSSSVYDVGTVSSTLAESFEYDALGRLTSAGNSVGTTTTQYTNFTTKSVTDALGNQKDYVTDGLGRLIYVIEYLDGLNYTTSYEWNAADKLTKITDALGNVRNFTYDGRGFRLTAEDLHASSDTIFGTWTSTYDDVGNQLTSSSPNGITTTYTYDDLNRVTIEDASSASGTEITYSYDTCTNGTGMLCSTAVLGGAETSLTYYDSGNVATKTTSLALVPYTTSYTYDYQNNILTTTQPDGSIVQNTYNSIGKINSVSRRGASDGAFSTIASTLDYGPDGQLVSKVNENGTTETYIYDANQRYRLTQKLTNGFKLNTAAPVTTTTTTSIYSGAGDGSMFKNDIAWDVAVDATTANVANSIINTATVRTGKISTGYSINRGFLSFDTSMLPDDAVITGATLNLYVNATLDDDNDGDDWITVVQGSQASSTALVVDDYDNIGLIEGIDTVDRKDITAISTGAYLSILLNGTGQSWISLSSDTKLALREGHDVIDSAFGAPSPKSNALVFRTSEYPETASDPYLEITYTQTTTSTPVAVETVLQDLTYSYDVVGNIDQIIDASGTDTAKTTDYTYDDLYRLKSTTVTGATSDNYSTTFDYNILGDITSKSDEGAYSYDGDSTSGSYANPHAVTSINKIDGTAAAYTYDNNGNLLSDGTKSYEWDWRNRLTQTSALTSETVTSAPTTVSFYSSVGDGDAFKSGSPLWTIVHDAMAGTSVDSATSSADVFSGRMGTGYFGIERAFLPFDTSSLPDDATITSASLQIYVSNKMNIDDDGDDYVTVVQSSQASPTSLIAIDFSNDGAAANPVEGVDVTGRKDITSITTDANLIFDLNTIGQGFISKSSSTLLGLREGHDATNSAITTTANTQFDLLQFRTSEYADTDYDPLLSVTYTQPVTSETEAITATFAYDASDHRVSKTSATSTTYYPSDDYSIEGATSTTHISDASGLVATIEDTSGASTIHTIHTDHLGSTSVVTDEDGIMVELMDYYPFGTERLSWTDGSSSEQKTFIGEYSDDETGLSYLDARYYNGDSGQFLSEDSVFLGMGTGSQQQQLALLDPQLQNSYAYARDNPIILTDANGNFLDILADIAFATYDVGALIYDEFKTGGENRLTNSAALGADIAGAAIPFVTGAGVAVRVGAHADDAIDALRIINSTPLPKTGVLGGPGAGKGFSQSIKDAARAESNNRCVFCGRETTRVPGPTQSNIDHAIPKSIGGSNLLDNAQNTCRDCNLSKWTSTTNDYMKKINDGFSKYVDKK